MHNFSITNIDANINRTLVSLKREAKRRMKLLENYPGVDDVDQYMQLYYSGKTTEPMPHLLIVSDEFAELKKEEPEIIKVLKEEPKAEETGIDYERLWKVIYTATKKAMEEVFNHE